MKLFFIMIIYINSFCYAQWVQQQSNTPRHLFGIDIIDGNTGFVCGDQVGSIIKTTNSGINWILYDEPTNDQYNSISFADAMTGVVVGPPGILLRTTNGGINWATINHPGNDKGSVQFASSSTVYAAGDDIIKSTDGGITWSVILSGTILGQYQGLHFIDENTGIVVGRPGLIITTTNGGLNWIQRTMFLPVQFGDSTLTDVMFVNSLTGYASGNNGIVMKTTNSGLNWIYKPTGVLSWLQGIYFSDTQIGTIVGNTGRIMKTTDGGNTWINQTSPLNYPLWDVEFSNQNTGWIVGFNGLIVKTTNGGITWLNPISNGIPLSFNLEQNYPNPFNPQTKIKFDIKSSQQARLSIYNILGVEIEILINEKLNPGTYEVNWDAKSYSSGIYYYSLESGDFTETKKMVLLK